MKKLILIAIACFSILSACKKDDDPSKTDLLCGKNWKITSFTLTNGVNTIDLFSIVGDCAKDDIFKFNTNGTTVLDAKVRCDLTEPATETGTWIFNSTETIITLDGVESWEIIELTSKTLKVKYQMQEDGILYTANVTHTAI